MDPEYTISSWKVKAGKEEGRFKAQVYLKLDETQEPIKKVFSAKREYKAKERAKSWAEEQIQQYKKLKSPEARARTVAEEIHDYMDLFMRPPILSQSTWDNYWYWIRNHIIPIIGDILVSDVNMEDAQTIYASMMEKGLKPSCIQKVHSILNGFFNKMIELKRVKENPVKGTKRPKVEQNLPKPLSDEDLDKFWIKFMLRKSSDGKQVCLHWSGQDCGSANCLLLIGQTSASPSWRLRWFKTWLALKVGT